MFNINFSPCLTWTYKHREEKKKGEGRRRSIRKGEKGRGKKRTHNKLYHLSDVLNTTLQFTNAYFWI